MKSWTRMTVIGLLLLWGCSEEPSSSNNTPKPDQGNPDMKTPKPDLGKPDMEPDLKPDMCSPLLECPVGACGMVDDGCGGSLDCGVCECTNGQPDQPNCGLCGLGVKTCNGEQASCLAPPSIPGLDGLDDTACSNALLYVDLSAVQTGMGTREAPYSQLKQAYAQARQTPSVKAILIKGVGTQNIDGGLELADGVSLIGGWGAAWEPMPENKPTLVLKGTFPNKDMFGIAARNIDNPTLLYNLQILTPDQSEPGASNYALYVKDSSSLELENVDLAAGAAGIGSKGNNGQKGEDGAHGDDAGNSTFGGFPSIGEAGYNTTPNFAACQMLPFPNEFCKGGSGGRGRHWSDVLNSVDAEKPGKTSPSQGAGGTGGTVSRPDGRAGSLGQYMAASAINGQGGAALGSVINGFWAPNNNAQDGGVGPMGGGGGGGGGAFSSGLDLPPYCGTCNGCKVCPAPHGGGGGGGGEGGQGGEAGQAGGSSFGIFIVNGKVKLTQSFVRAGFGGAGGAGGEGGEGGKGGFSGKGGRNIIVLGQSRPTVYRGGDGAPGQKGLPGGAGGGGAGGDSVGVYCEGGTLEFDAFSRFEHGGTAFGGTSSGFPGADGRGLETFGCN